MDAYKLLGWLHATSLLKSHQYNGQKAAAEFVKVASGQVAILALAGCPPEEAQMIMRIYIHEAMAAISRQTSTAQIIEPPWTMGFNVHVFRPHSPQPFIR